MVSLCTETNDTSVESKQGELMKLTFLSFELRDLTAKIKKYLKEL